MAIAINPSPNLLRSGRFLIAVLGGKGVNYCLLPPWGVHAAALEAVIFAGTLINFETAVTTDGTGTVVVGAGFLDDFQLVKVVENIEFCYHGYTFGW